MQGDSCRPAWPPCFIANAAPADPTAAAGRLAHRRCRTGRLRLRGGIAVDDRTRLAVVAREPGQEQAGDEKAHREHRGGARQQIGRAAARHEAGAAADAEAAAFGFLQQHRADQRRDDHEMDDDNDSLHFYLPSQTKAPRSGCSSGLAGFEVARCYTIARGIVTPDGMSEVIAFVCSASRFWKAEAWGEACPLLLLMTDISSIIDK